MAEDVNDPAEQALRELFHDDFYIDPRDASPSSSEPLLRQALARDPDDETSTLLLASVLARQLAAMYVESEPGAMPWAEEVETGDEDGDVDEYIERVWHEAILAREAEIGRLLSPLAELEAAAVLLVMSVDAAAAWRRDNVVEHAVPGDLSSTRERVSRTVDLTGSRYGWYLVELGTMVNNYGDISLDVWLSADQVELRRVMDRRLSAHHWHDYAEEYLLLSRYEAGVCAEVVDLRPHLTTPERGPSRMNWESVSMPDLTSAPLPVGHPVQADHPLDGMIHYGFNPGPE